MKIDDVYQFIFHPWSDDHSFKTQIAATITDIALTIFSAGLFLIPFLYRQWKDRNVKVMISQTSSSRVADNVLRPEQKPEKSSTQTITPVIVSPPKLSPKAQKVKTRQAQQLKDFEKWAGAGQWDRIHSAHYDWWMYPVDRPSRGHGEAYAVYEKEIEELKADPEFMCNYLRGVELGAEAWGWDIHAKKPIKNPNKDQKWQNWGVRLGKMGESLRLFEQHELRESMLAYAMHAQPVLEDWVWKALGLQG